MRSRVNVSHTHVTFAVSLQHVQVESWANRLHTARIGSYSWLAATGVVCIQHRQHCASDISKCYTGARDTMFARSARNNWIPKRTDS